MCVVVLLVTFVGFMVLLMVFMGLLVVVMALLGFVLVVTLLLLVVTVLFPLLPCVAFPFLHLSITVSVCVSSRSPLLTLDVTFFVVLDTLFLMLIFVMVVRVFSSMWIFCCEEGNKGIICKSAASV